MNWRPIYKQSSLPYNEGDRFYARINECRCEIEEPHIKKCLKTRPCIDDFLVLNELSFFKMEENGRFKRDGAYTKNGVIARYKYWKIIHPEPGKREDIFVCLCKEIAMDRFGEEWIECCHCHENILRCSDHCRNAVRGK